MKSNILKSLILVVLIVATAIIAQAEPKQNSPSVAPAAFVKHQKYRISADYNYMMISPGDLNNYSSNVLWSGTKIPTDFNALNGFTIGAAYLLDKGFLGLEYTYALQELSKTFVPPSTYVQYSLNYQAIYLTYDWHFKRSATQSYELGIGAGYAVKYQYHWLANSTATEEVIWQDTPFVFKVRANYNYQFISGLGLRIGATYEYATSSSLTADSSHPTLSVTDGQQLRNSTGENVKVDISGLRLNAGILYAF